LVLPAADCKADIYFALHQNVLACGVAFYPCRQSARAKSAGGIQNWISISRLASVPRIG
jgi:hypothetical protein